MGRDIVIPDVAARILRSPKYRHLCDATVRRMAGWAAARSRSAAEAEKRARRKLHQVYGAYLAQWDASRAAAVLADAPAACEGPALRDTCRRILALHASTRERLALLDGFYERIFAVTGPPARVLDIGCGLHPFALPWMHLPEGCLYRAWEIDRRIVDLANGLFPRTPLPGGKAECRDVLVELPAGPADVCFLLKMLPCLEQQAGCTERLLRRIPARWIVVSFPTASLSGRDVGMARHYADRFEATLRAAGLEAEKIALPSELLYVVDAARLPNTPGEGES